MANTLEVMSKIKPLEAKVETMETDVKEYADHRIDGLDEKITKHFVSMHKKPSKREDLVTLGTGSSPLASKKNLI